MYTVADYGSMIADPVRMRAFARALRGAVSEDSVVVDIGTGTGIFALLACRFGARRVYAIEPDDAIQVARDLAAANGYSDRIEFIQALSTDVTLPERADVIIADIGGVLPWFQQHLPSMADARRRMLKPGGTLIPQTDVAWAAVVESPEMYARHAGPWRDNAFGFDMEAARHIVINTWNKGSATPDQLLTGVQRWAEIEYRQVEDSRVHAVLRWTALRRGIGHGFVAGFDRTVADGIYLSNAPTAPDDIRPKQIYGMVFFPWPEPVPLDAGDAVTVNVDATLVNGSYVWSWKTRTGDVAFDQSTFLGTPLSPASLEKVAASYRPTLNHEGRVIRSVLTAMDAGLTVHEIAARVAAEFPDRFARGHDALKTVAELSRQYG